MHYNWKCELFCIFSAEHIPNSIPLDHTGSFFTRSLVLDGERPNVSFAQNLCWIVYFRSGNICEVLIIENLAKKTNSRIKESRGNYYYNSATKEK